LKEVKILIEGFFFMFQKKKKNKNKEDDIANVRVDGRCLWLTWQQCIAMLQEIPTTF
jgi:hypothetical protein